MERNEKLIAKITSEATIVFPSFGGGFSTEGNPIAAALKDAPPMFAAGVDISAVVRLTLKMAGHSDLLAACKAAVFVLKRDTEWAKELRNQPWYEAAKQAIAKATKQGK